MPSRVEYRNQLKQVIQWNKSADFATIHQLMHEGNYETAIWWADDIGLNTPPDQNPPTGVPIPDRQKEFLRKTIESHQPTALGFPDHEFESSSE